MEKDRIKIIAFLVIGALAVFVIRYAFIMLTPSSPVQSGRGKVAIERGTIYDRNGNVLAISTRLGNITIWKPDISDLDELAENIAPIIGMTPLDVKQKIEASSADFVYLKKNVDRGAVAEVENEKAKGLLDGVNIEPVSGRIYPEGSLAASVLGFVGEENIGLGGIEYAFEHVLSPREGGDVFLTIDKNVQFILEGIAERVKIDNEAEFVMLLALEPKTGDILGEASVPGFDPNNFRAATTALRNDRPSVWAYEPGSVFKIFSMAALLDGGAINANSTFLCNGSYERVTSSGEVVTINCLGSHGQVRARDIIIKSCNAGAAYASDRMAATSFYGTISRLGFGDKTGAAFPGETRGFLRTADKWSSRSLPTIAMGQEIAVSALQMLKASTAIANDGLLVEPRIVIKTTGKNGKKETFFTQQEKRVFSPNTAREMRRYMMDVTSDIGTGWRANIDDLSLAVKTGTAQMIDAATASYSETDFLASCMAILPADTPQLVIYIVIGKPKGWSYLGGQIAAPPIREAAEALINYLGIPRGRNPRFTHPGSVRTRDERLPNIEGYLPDYKGYAKRQLLPLLLIDEVNFSIEGEGWVTRQDPPVGTLVTRGMKVTLYLESH